MSDLRAKFEALNVRVDNKAKEVERRKAAVEHAKQRLKELDEEAKALGVNSLADLSSAVTELEQSINAELSRIEKELDNPDEVVTPVPPTPPAAGDNLVPLDELLERAST